MSRLESTPNFYIIDPNPVYVSYGKQIESLSKSLDISELHRIIYINEEFPEPKESHFESQTVINAVIHEIHSNYVILNCLIDEDKNITQYRKFDTETFKEKINLIEGQGVQITIKTKPGIRIFEFRESKVASSFFNVPEDIFSDLRGSALFPK
jgi:hypothetical protein